MIKQEKLALGIIEYLERKGLRIWIMTFLFEKTIFFELVIFIWKFRIANVLAGDNFKSYVFYSD